MTLSEEYRRSSTIFHEKQKKRICVCVCAFALTTASQAPCVPGSAWDATTARLCLAELAAATHSRVQRVRHAIAGSARQSLAKVRSQAGAWERVETARLTTRAEARHPPPHRQEAGFSP